MVKNHIKRINAPKRWDILRKDHKFISRPNPGTSLDFAVSLNTCLKEMLGKTQTTKESKYLIKYKGALVNGVRRYDEKYAVGFLDVLTLPALEENYRMIVNIQNRLELVRISSAEARTKLSKIANKKILPGGKIQVNCEDGRNFLFEKAASEKMGLNDTIIYSIPEQKAIEVYKLEKGALVFLYKGKHIGELVHVEGFKGGNILFKKDGELVETRREYALAVGKDKPVLTVMPHAHEHAHEHSAAENGDKKAKAKKNHN